MRDVRDYRVVLIWKAHARFRTLVVMKAETSAMLKVIAAGLFIIFLVFLGLSAPLYLHQRDIVKTWPRTQGKVLSSSVVSVPVKHGTNYTARFLIEYRLGDSVLTSTVNSGYSATGKWIAQGWADRFPEGSTVTIAYDPQQPSTVRLNPGYNRYFFAAPLLVTEIGLGFAAAAIALYVFARWSEKRTRGNGAVA